MRAPRWQICSRRPSAWPWSGSRSAACWRSTSPFKRQAGLDSLVLLAPTLRYVNPLARFAPLVALLMKTAKNDPIPAFI